jgi:hypothetical protein
MNDFQEKFNEIVNRHGYIVRVNLVESRLTVDYAGQKTTSYLVWSDDHGWYLEYNGKEIISLKVYIVRLYILLDIYRQCRRLGISYDVVRFYDYLGGISDLLTILPLQLTEEEKSKELLLNNVVMSVIQGKPANSFEDSLEVQFLLHEYLQLKGLLL